MKRAGIFGCLVVVLGLPGLAQAGLVTWEFGGTVTNVWDGNDLLGGSVSVGTSFSGAFTFDTSTPDSRPADLVVGDFVGAVTAFSSIVGGNVFSATAPMDIFVANDQPPIQFARDFYGLSGIIGPVGESLSVFLQLLDDNATMFSTDSIPVTPPSLDDAISTGFGIGSQAMDLSISGEITSLTPEPSSLLLLTVGTIVLVGRRGKRNRLRRSSQRSPHAPRFLVAIAMVALSGLAERVRAQTDCGCMEIVFVIDVTGSMEPPLVILKNDLRNLVENTAVPASGGDLRLAPITFNDPGLGDDSIAVRSPLTTDINAVLDQIDALSTGGGANAPEASDEALREMLGGTICPSSGDFNVPFRSSCIKHAILITDNLPAGCDDRFDFTPDVANAHTRALEALAAGIMISAIYPPTAGSAGPCGNPITNQACVIMEDYALTSRGVFSEVDENGLGILAALADQIRECPDCDDDGINDLCQIDCAASPDCVPPCGDGDDCNGNGIIDVCDIGDCPPSDPRCVDCDGNMILDGCDLADCTGDPACADCNTNLVPDGCEPDCNANDVADECDLTAGTSCDMDEDGVLDECGACCEDSVCRNSVSWHCQFGLFANGVPCDEESCEIRGCCVDSACRTDLNLSQCLAIRASRIYSNPWCSFPLCTMGACCFSGGSCQWSTNEASCGDQGGAFFGGTNCSMPGVCDAPIVDCDNDCLDDLPGSTPAVLTNTSYACDDSLSRIMNNVLRFQFACPITLPSADTVEIKELLEGSGNFGVDLSANFTFTLEGTPGFETILRIEENGRASAH